MRFYSRTNSKTWNALEFIRLFSKHSFSLSLDGRTTGAYSLTVDFSCMHVDVENSVYGSTHRSSRSISFFYDFEGFDIFCASLKSEIRWDILLSIAASFYVHEKASQRSIFGKLKTMLIIIAHDWIWLKWTASYGACGYCIHNFHIHINWKLHKIQSLAPQWMPNINFVKMIAIEIVCLSRSGIPNVSLLHVLHRAPLLFPSIF